MIPALDSSFDAPSLSEAQTAAAAGVRVWSGYLVAVNGLGLAAPWTDLAFWNAAHCGAPPIAFCSGWDDPRALRTLAAQLGVRLCLDVERFIRDDGAWVQAWLDASGAGLYGVASVHAARRAAFHILADYPGADPRATWPSWLQRPAAPCGWQWQGSHQEFGCQVDSTWLDDWFAPPQEDEMLRYYQGTDNIGGAVWISNLLWRRSVPSEGEKAILDQQADITDATVHVIQQEVLDAIPVAGAAQVDITALVTALTPHLTATVDVAALATALEGVLPGADAKAVEAELAAQLAKP